MRIEKSGQAGRCGRRTPPYPQSQSALNKLVNTPSNLYFDSTRNPLKVLAGEHDPRDHGVHRRGRGLPHGGAGVEPDAVPLLVERFDRRGTEPFEQFRSEFGQNSARIKEILLEFIRNSEIFKLF